MVAVHPVDLVDEEHVVRSSSASGSRRCRPSARAPGRRPAGCQTPSSLADDVREARLAEARRADEQDVVERLAARLRGRERDRELLLDALLPDEVGEAASAGASARAPRPPLRPAVPGTGCSCRPASTRAAPDPHRQELDPVRERALRVDRACSRARRARRARPRARRSSRPRRTRIRRRPIFSFSSSTIRSAVFLPMPGMVWKRAVSSRAIARRSSSRRRAGDDRERNLRPDTVDGEQLLEQLSLGAVGEPVELHRVLAHVQVRLDRDLLAPSARCTAAVSPRRDSRRRRRRARALRRRRDGLAAQPRDHVSPCPSCAGAAARSRGRWPPRARRRRGSASAARQAEDRLHHPLHLGLLGAAVAADRLLHAVRRVLGARNPARRPRRARRRAPDRRRARCGRRRRRTTPRSRPHPARARR